MTDQTEAEAAAPSLSVLAQYVKDLSFENPGAPISLQARQQTPPLKIDVNVGARPVGAAEFEVTLTMEAKAGSESPLFVAEVVYAGLFRVSNVPAEHLQPFVLIECPRMLFPFARQILADATRNGGYPPLMIDPIDFVALYRQNLARSAAPVAN